ncbi:MAG TPA: helix-turn-helix domain-containing protein [Desulfomonilia bacterium]|nr:helix-turn-helix domain-containing protein [Desulfomonilia bacterium]
MYMRAGEDIHEDLLRDNVADFERHIIISALKRTHGNQTKAAHQLGTTKRILANRIRKYKIDVKEFRKVRYQTKYSRLG